MKHHDIPPHSSLTAAKERCWLSLCSSHPRNTGTVVSMRMMVRGEGPATVSTRLWQGNTKSYFPPSGTSTSTFAEAPAEPMGALAGGVPGWGLRIMGLKKSCIFFCAGFPVP